MWDYCVSELVALPNYSGEALLIAPIVQRYFREQLRSVAPNVVTFLQSGRVGAVVSSLC